MKNLLSNGVSIDDTENYRYAEDIAELFEKQVNKTPDNVAIIFEETKLTYKEVNEKVNQLANYLVKTESFKPDKPVAVCIDGSEYFIISILAILKIGVI